MTGHRMLDAGSKEYMLLAHLNDRAGRSMRKNMRRARGLGLVVLTPALTGLPQAAAARSIDTDAIQIEPSSPTGLSHGAAARALLKATLLEIPTYLKLAIAGEIVPLRQPVKWVRPVGRQDTTTSPTYGTCNTCGPARSPSKPPVGKPKLKNNG